MDNFTRFNPPGHLFDIGGHRLYLHAMGERQHGLPTVILEAGHSDWSHCWPRIQPEIARFTRVIAYDRAGFGWSDPGPRPRTPVRLVTELHRLLETACETGPYIFVGHSLGAALGRLFAGMYPQEVVGMVWVDSAHEHMQKYMPFWGPAYHGLVASGHLGWFLARIGLVRRAGRQIMLDNYPFGCSPEDQEMLFAQMGSPRFFETMRKETQGWYPPQNWERTPVSFGELPIIMIEAQYPSGAPPGCPPRQWQQFRTGWKQIQSDLSCLSSSVQRVPVESGHNVMFEYPEVIIQAIKDMLGAFGNADHRKAY